MDKNIEIVLGSTKNVESVNTDNFERVELSFKPSLLLEYDTRNVLSAAEFFNTERNATPVYRIYGSLEYLSLLNGVKSTYSTIGDFLTGTTNSSHKDIYNSFDFYLVRPSSSGYTEILYSGETEVNDTTVEYIVKEEFKIWTGISGEYGELPVGWEFGNVYGTASIQPYTRRETVLLGARFTLGNWNGISASLEIYKNFPITDGEFILEINSSVLVSNGSEKLTVSLIGEDNTTVFSINTLITGNGDKKYNISISPTTPINKIKIQSSALDNNITVRYVRLYKISNNLNTDEIYSWDSYVREFEIIATPNDFEIYKMGFTKNIFNEQKYGFLFNKDIDISNYFDALGFPVTELYLYAKYRAKAEETYNYTYWYANGVSIQKPIGSQNTLKVYGDVIEYTKERYEQTQLAPQIHYIHTPINGEVLVWKYNPFIPLQLQYLSNQLSRANSGTTVYDAAVSIPTFATQLDDDGNFVWREILEQGYIDPLTGDGVDYPFINKRRYLFANLILTIVPDLSDRDTQSAFRNLQIGTSTLKIKPLGDLDNIGKPCQ